MPRAHPSCPCPPAFPPRPPRPSSSHQARAGAPGVRSLPRKERPRVSFLLPRGLEGEDGEAKFRQQDVGRRRGREAAGGCRPCQEETTMSMKLFNGMGLGG